MILDDHRIGLAAESLTVPGYRGHDHFWDRAMSRGVLLRASGTATVAGLMLAIYLPMFEMAGKVH